jgi:molecular chaperone DnaK (HSP70)
MEEKFPEQRISPYILGIDFGTSNCTVAIYKKGRVEFLKIEGREIVPSVVTFGIGKNPLVGEQAKRSVMIYPDKTILSIKRELGNQEWKYSENGKDYSPTDICALILGYLCDGSQKQTDVDLEGTVKRAILCHPANFESNKCEELKRAAEEMIGLEVRLLEEPVAAAIACAAHRVTDTKILVYDLGGGTFDVCILHAQCSADPDMAKQFKVLGKGGIAKLGGDDFDARLMKRFAEKIKDESGIDVFDLERDQGVSQKKLKTAQQKLKDLAERVKIELAVAETAEVNEPSIIQDEAGKEYGLKEEKVTREEFLDASKDLLEETRREVEKTLKEADLTADEIDRIILVGGSTLMCGVKEIIKDMFGKEPYSDIDPRTIVAHGAAIYGAGGIVEYTRSSHFLGVELLNQRFGRLIDKNVPLPAKAKKVYQAADVDPEAVRITVMQSMKEIEYVTDEGATCLGEFHLVIPEEKRKKDYRNIVVTMEITEENLLRVSAELEDENEVSHKVEIKK